MPDTSEPKTTPIILVTIVTCVFLFFSSIGLLYVFNRVKQRQIHVKLELAPTVDLQNIRNYENGMLHGYAVVDGARKVVRIPIERAMELEVLQPWRQDARFNEGTPPPKSNDGGTTHGQ